MSCVPPRGAFYAFPRIDVLEEDATWVKQLLLEKHILTVQGSGFGQKPGSKHFRIVFLPQEEMLRKAYSEIRDFMTRRG
jgi:alanine-synthesizing transaminase